MSSPTQPTHNTPILVVKDDYNLCTLVVEILTLEGYPVTAALFVDDIVLSARDALSALQHAARPTIILADPIICRIQGTELLTAYLQDAARRQPHLLYLLTALANPAEAVAWLHADGYIPMPIDFDALFALIAEGERILRDRDATPPDPFTIDY